MSDQKNYAVVSGFIQFPVRDGQANNKPVRYIRLRAAGTQKMVDVTVWDQHQHIPLAQGDYVSVEGELRQRKGQKDGVEITYNNLSARLLINHGSGSGTAPKVVNPVAAQAEDEVPF